MKKSFTKKCSLLFLVMFFFCFGQALVADASNTPVITVDIGGFNSQSFSEPTSVSCPTGVNAGSTAGCISIGWMSQYFGAIYQYGVGLAAILAAVMVMIGGFVWLTSAGSPDRVGTAKELIVGALLGLFLALFSYLILYTINPELIKNKPVVVTSVAALDIQCCQQADGSYAYETASEKKCKSGGVPEATADNCKSKQVLCEEKGGIYASAVSSDQSGLESQCKVECATRLRGNMASVEKDKEYPSAGCCLCDIKSTAYGCCFKTDLSKTEVKEYLGCQTAKSCIGTFGIGIYFKEIEDKNECESACKKQ